jgi:hypothetical protein
MLTDRRAMGLICIACWPEFAMPMTDVMTVIDHLRHKEDVADGWICELAGIPICLRRVALPSPRSPSCWMALMNTHRPGRFCLLYYWNEPGLQLGLPSRPQSTIVRVALRSGN